MNVDQLINAVTRVKAELPESLRRSGHNVFIRLLRGHQEELEDLEIGSQELLLGPGALRRVVMARLGKTGEHKGTKGTKDGQGGLWV